MTVSLKSWRARYSKRVQDYPALVKKIQSLPKNLYDVEQHGALTIDPDRYPLYSVKTKHDPKKPSVILSALNHGHEANGGEALIRLLENRNIPKLFEHFNVVAIPCINPWGYEHDSRRNSSALDINRDFKNLNSETEEAQFVKKVLGDIKKRGDNVVAFCDMHETFPDKDTEFRKETAELDGTPLNTTPIARKAHIMTADDTEHRCVGTAMINRMKEAGAEIQTNGTVVASESKDGLVISQSNITLRAYCQKLFSGAVCFSSEIIPKHENKTDEQAIKVFDAMISGMVTELKPTA